MKVTLQQLLATRRRHTGLHRNLGLEGKLKHFKTLQFRTGSELVRTPTNALGSLWVYVSNSLVNQVCVEAP